MDKVLVPAGVVERDCSQGSPSPYFRAIRSGGRSQTEGCSFCRLRNGPADLETPGGRPASWCWDGNCLRATSDRYGILPLYYYVNGGEIGLSPSLITLIKIGAPTELDDAALAVFLRLGNFVGEATPFRCIRMLPPCGTLLWEDGVVTVECARPISEPISIGREDAIVRYLQLFREATERCCQSRTRVVIPLSGGVDSRHILAALGELGVRPEFCLTARTEIPELSNDPEISAQVSRVAGVSHVIIDQPKHDLATQIVRNRLTEFSTLQHTWVCVIADYLRERADAIFDGIGGDVLSAGHRLNSKDVASFEAGRFEELSERLLGEPSREQLLRATLTESKYRCWSRDLAMAALCSELKRHIHAANPMGAFIFWNRTRRDIALAPFAILRRVTAVHSPFLDSDVFDFLTALPASLFLDHSFHRDVVACGYARFGMIPYATNRPFPRFHSVFRTRSLDFARSLPRRRNTEMLKWNSVLPRVVFSTISGAQSGGNISTLATYLLGLEDLLHSSAEPRSVGN